MNDLYRDESGTYETKTCTETVQRLYTDWAWQRRRVFVPVSCA